jgi:hypothetical protein
MYFRMMARFIAEAALGFLFSQENIRRLTLKGPLIDTLKKGNASCIATAPLVSVLLRWCFPNQ